MASFLPTKLTASNMLAVLFIFARQLQLLDDEINRTEGDQNILTCRGEYIESIWGMKLGQVFTSDFDLSTYRTLLIRLVSVAMTDSTKQNIKETIRAYFPTLIAEQVEFSPERVSEAYVYAGDYTFVHQPVDVVLQVEVDVGAGYVIRPTTDYQIKKDVGINYETVLASDQLQFINNIPTPGNKVRVVYQYNLGEIYSYSGDKILSGQPVLRIISVEVVELKSSSILAPGGLSGQTLILTVGTNPAETVTFTPAPVTVDDVVAKINSTMYRVQATKVNTDRVRIYAVSGSAITVGAGTANAIFGFTPGQVAGFVSRPASDYTLQKDVSVFADSTRSSDKLVFTANIPGSGNIVRIFHTYNKYADIYEYWKNQGLMVGYNWQDNSLFFAGSTVLDSGIATAGTSGSVIVDSNMNWIPNIWVGKDAKITGKGQATITANTATSLTVSIPGATSGDTFQIVQVGYNPTTHPERNWSRDYWSGVGVIGSPLIPDLESIAFILFGVQIVLKGISGAEVFKIEQYVIPALNQFVKPAGISYKIIVTDIDAVITMKIKATSTKGALLLTSILGFGMGPFGSPAPVAPDDLGFGAPTLPEYLLP